MIKQGVWSTVLGLLLLSSSHAALRTELVIGGFAKPVFAVSPPGDTNRLFILEQHTGRIRIIDLPSGTVKGTPFMIVTNLLTGNEQGLLGMAFHPGYATNGYFYINQVARGGPAGHTEIARYQVQGEPLISDLADRSTRKVLLTYDQPESNHNGGWIGFGPDRLLYISSGDGGGANDQHGSPGNGQNRNTLLGKILRIDVDAGETYGIPDGNPFKGSTDFRQEIWAFGLRNPWRCSIDQQTGDLWIGDVGQGAREEIDLVPAGAAGLNFGWRPREGSIQNSAYRNETPITPAVEPVFDYPRSSGYSVTGGYVYRGSRIPSLRGKYIFADYGSARFWEITPAGTNGTVREITAELNPSPMQIRGPSSFGEDASGELYICDHSDGQIFRITGDEPTEIQLQVAVNEAGQLAITFNAVANQAYRLEAAQDFSATGTQWNSLSEIPAGSAGPVTLTAPVTGTQQYFRIAAL